MRSLVQYALALLLATGLGVSGACAEELATPVLKKAPGAKSATRSAAKAAPSASSKDRRPGELEGWDSGLKGPVAAKSKRPPDAVGERAVPDGGLPLPEPRLSNDPSSPVGFDKSGNMGSTFKF